MNTVSPSPAYADREHGCTPEVIEKFAEALAETGKVKDACIAANISRRTALYWRHEHADFASAWAEALKVACWNLEDEGYRRAHDGVDKPVYQMGAEVGLIREYSDTMLIFLLKAADPNKYRERVALTGENGEPLKADVVIRHMFKPPEGTDGDGAATA